MIDFLCIGAQKAGTTWLMANLSRHPSIWTPPFAKELHYFDAVHLGYGKQRALKRYEKRGARMVEKNPARKTYLEKVLDPDWAFTDEWYAHLFSIAPKRARKGECTPLYCAIDEAGVEHVNKVMPSGKLIYMIRDPFERALSSFRMAMEQQETDDGGDVAGLLNKNLFAKRGDYRGNIPRWEAVIDPARILYIPFGMVKSDPVKVMRDVEKHLDLPAFDGYPRLGDSINKTSKQGKTIGDDIIARIREMTAPQYPFLAERFGDDFVKLTK